MFLKIILAIFLGTISGIFTGLIPGIHVNLISLITYQIFQNSNINKIIVSCYIISLAITHTFIDSIPSIFLGIPNSETILNLLPGHKLLLKGKGKKAVELTIIGSFFSTISFIILLNLFIKIFKIISPWIKNKSPFIIIAIIIYILLKNKTPKKILKSSIIFLLSGLLGLFIFKLNNNDTNYFMPLLSGMFGIAPILTNLKNNKIPPQKNSKIKLKKEYFKISFISTIISSITAFLPGIGSAHSAIIAQDILKTKTKNFLILTGTINTANLAISLITLYTLNKSRNGAILTISKLIDKLNFKDLNILILTIIISSAISTIISLRLNNKITKIINKINYKKTMLIVLTIIIIITIILNQITGIIILIISTTIGIITLKNNIPRNNLLGCITLPVIINLIRIYY